MHAPGSMTTLASLEITQELLVESQTSLPDETELEQQLQHLQNTELYLKDILERAEKLETDQSNHVIISPTDRMREISVLLQEIAKYAQTQTTGKTTPADRHDCDGDKKRPPSNTDPIQQCTVNSKSVEGNAPSPFFILPQHNTIPKLFDQHYTKTLTQPHSLKKMENTSPIIVAELESDAICLPDQTGRATRLTTMVTELNSTDPPKKSASPSTHIDEKRDNHEKSKTIKTNATMSGQQSVIGVRSQAYSTVSNISDMNFEEAEEEMTRILEKYQPGIREQREKEAELEAASAAKVEFAAICIPEDELLQNHRLPDIAREDVNGGNTQQHGVPGYNGENTSEKKRKIDHVDGIADSGCVTYLNPPIIHKEASTLETVPSHQSSDSGILDHNPDEHRHVINQLSSLTAPSNCIVHPYPPISPIHTATTPEVKLATSESRRQQRHRVDETSTSRRQHRTVECFIKNRKGETLKVKRTVDPDTLDLTSIVKILRDDISYWIACDLASAINYREEKLDAEGISRDDPRRLHDREIAYPERMATLVPHYTPSQWDMVRLHVASPAYSKEIRWTPRQTGQTRYLDRPEGPLDKVIPMNKSTRDRIFADRMTATTRTDTDIHTSPLNYLLAQIVNDTVRLRTIVDDVYSHLDTPTALPITTEEIEDVGTYRDLFSDSEDEESCDPPYEEHCSLAVVSLPHREGETPTPTDREAFNHIVKRLRRSRQDQLLREGMKPERVRSLFRSREGKQARNRKNNARQKAKKSITLAPIDSDAIQVIVEINGTYKTFWIRRSETLKDLHTAICEEFHFPTDLHYWFIHTGKYYASTTLLDAPISNIGIRHGDTMHAHIGGLRGGMETATGIKRGGTHLDDEPITERSNGRLLDDQGTKISESTKEFTWIQISIISFEDQAAVEVVLDTLIQSGWPLDREKSLTHYASKSSHYIELIGQQVKAEGILFLPLEQAQHFGLHPAPDTWPYVTHMLLPRSRYSNVRIQPSLPREGTVYKYPVVTFTGLPLSTMLNDQIHHVYSLLESLSMSTREKLAITAVIGRPKTKMQKGQRKQNKGPLMVKLSVDMNPNDTEGIYSLVEHIQAHIGEDQSLLTSGPYEFKVWHCAHKNAPFHNQSFLRPIVSILNHPLQLVGLDRVAEHIHLNIPEISIASVHVRIDFVSSEIYSHVHHTIRRLCLSFNGPPITERQRVAIQYALQVLTENGDLELQTPQIGNESPSPRVQTDISPRERGDRGGRGRGRGNRGGRGDDGYTTVGRYHAPPPVPGPISSEARPITSEFSQILARTNSRIDRIEEAQRTTAAKMNQVATQQNCIIAQQDKFSEQQERIHQQQKKNDDILVHLVAVLDRLSHNGSALNEGSEMT